MPLVWEHEVIRFVPPSDPDEWIDLKRELSSGDEDGVYEALMGIDSSLQGGMEDVRVALRVTGLDRERVNRSIVAWSYRHNGEPVEVTPENIGRLDRRTYEEVVAKVDELNPFEMRRPKSGNSRRSPTSMRASSGKRRQRR